MDSSHYEQFKNHLERGDRAGAAVSVRRFVASFNSLDDKTKWVKWYFENEKFGHRIRHEIYEALIFPVLLHGYHQSDPWCLRWLVRTVQNIYSAESLWTQIDGKTDQGLLTQLVAVCPDDTEARQALLQSYIRRFEYMIHEWPAGVLYGHDGASSEECQLILLDVQIARRLDADHEHDAYLSDFEGKVFEYQLRLCP